MIQVLEPSNLIPKLAEGDPFSIDSDRYFKVKAGVLGQNANKYIDMMSFTEFNMSNV